MPDVLEKTPWPAQGIEQETCIGDYDWGYLVIYTDGGTEFLINEKPSDRSIVARWGAYFVGSQVSERRSAMFRRNPRFGR